MNERGSFQNKLISFPGIAQVDTCSSNKVSFAQKIIPMNTFEKPLLHLQNVFENDTLH